MIKNLFNWIAGSRKNIMKAEKSLNNAIGKISSTLRAKNWDENGILKMEFDFPKTMKTYWDNGKLENEATGILYKGEQDVILLDSGLHVSYSESGKKLHRPIGKQKGNCI
jgi:MORN repeat variant.